MQQSQSIAPSALPDLGAYRQIYTQEEWNGFYPKPTPETFFHALIARATNEQGEQQQKVLKMIECLNGERIGNLLAKDKDHHNLIPLHIAAMKANALVVEALIKKLAGVPRMVTEALNARDSFGWTPLHHALLSSEAVFRRLQDLGASLTIPTEMGEDCHELQKRIGRVNDQRTLRTTFVMQDGQPKKLSALSQDDMQRALGNVRYTDCVLYSPEHYRHLWQQQPSRDPVILTFHCAAYQEWKKNQVELQIRECEELKGKNLRVLGLYVRNMVKAGTPLGIYGGLYQPWQMKNLFNLADYFSEEQRNADYLLGSVNAAHAGSAFRIVNCGWPNTVASPLLGGDSHVIFIAGEEIEKRKEIRFCYGIAYAALSFGAQVVLGAKEMREFFQRCPLQKLFSEYRTNCLRTASITNRDISLKEYAETMIQKDRLFFPLSCPAALLDLHFRSIVPADQWGIILSKPEEDMNIKEFIDIYGILAWAVRALIKRIEQFEERFSNTEIKKEIGKWVLGSIGTLTIMQILKGLQILGGEKEKLNSENIEKRLQELDSWLRREYTDWTQDKEAPLNYAFRLKVFIESFQDKPIDLLIASSLQEMIDAKNKGVPESSESYRFIIDLLNSAMQRKRKTQS